MVYTIVCLVLTAKSVKRRLLRFLRAEFELFPPLRKRARNLRCTRVGIATQRRVQQRAWRSPRRSAIRGGPIAMCIIIKEGEMMDAVKGHLVDISNKECLIESHNCLLNIWRRCVAFVQWSMFYRFPRWHPQFPPSSLRRQRGCIANHPMPRFPRRSEAQSTKSRVPAGDWRHNHFQCCQISPVCKI